MKIPNTRHFHEITLIEDALSLWEKIKSTAGDHQWRPEVEEEYEDSQVKSMDLHPIPMRSYTQCVIGWLPRGGCRCAADSLCC